MNSRLPLPYSVKTVSRLSAPFRVYFSPRFYGWENVDSSRPSLFVGNHTLFAIDYALMGTEIYCKKGIMLRPVGDRLHFKIPLWRNLLTKAGVIDGSPENCEQLMKAGEHLVVYPGGAREAYKRKGETYRLFWNQRTGFIRLAVQHGYQILPFAAVGADTMYKILIDANEIMKSPLGRLLKCRGIPKQLKSGEYIPPIVRGVGPTLIPQPERFYFAFDRPIDAKRFTGGQQSKEALFGLRRAIEDCVNTQIKKLLRIQAQDKCHCFWRRLLTRL